MSLSEFERTWGALCECPKSGRTYAIDVLGTIRILIDGSRTYYLRIIPKSPRYAMPEVHMFTVRDELFQLAVNSDKNLRILEDEWLQIAERYNDW